MQRGLDRIVCVDWGRELTKRRAWVAEVATRRVSPLAVEPTVRALVDHLLAMPGRTLLGIDAALGVPRPWLERAREVVPAWSGAVSFSTWLPIAIARPGFVIEARTAAEWRWDRPFIAVPAGTGALRAFWERAGAPLLRRIDVRTGAKSVFVVSGIPGSVGSGTRALWTELARELPTDGVRLWPFDGALDAIDGRVVLGEIYPRVCYAMALADALPARLRALAKTDPDVRADAMAELDRAPWRAEHGVVIDALARARASEDDFDAMMSAAGLLRCVLEGVSLDDPDADPIEGGILGVSTTLARR